MRKDYLAINLDNCINDIPSTLSTQSMVFSSNKPLDQSKPAVIIFTSGSAGPPKGVAYRRYNLTLVACQQIWKNSIKEGYTILKTLPTHHGTGLILNTIPTIMGGGCIEFTHSKFDAAKTWERICHGGITSLSAVPTIFCAILGSATIFMQNMGVHRANDFLMLGRKLSVQELEQWGMVNRIFPKEGFHDRVLEFLREQLAVNDGKSMMEAKRLQNLPLRRDRILAVYDALEALAERHVEDAPNQRFADKQKLLRGK